VDRHVIGALSAEAPDFGEDPMDGWIGAIAREPAEIAPPANALSSKLRRGVDVEGSRSEGQDQQEELGEERSDLTLDPAYKVEGRRSP
jgi:hypothetical protein